MSLDDGNKFEGEATVDLSLAQMSLAADGPLDRFVQAINQCDPVPFIEYRYGDHGCTLAVPLPIDALARKQVRHCVEGFARVMAES